VEFVTLKYTELNRDNIINRIDQCINGQVISKRGLGLLLVVSIWLIGINIAWAEPLDREAQAQKMHELNQLAGKNVYSAPVKALQYAEEAVKQSIALQDQRAQSIALLNMGLAHLQLGNLPEVRRCLEESVVIAQQASYVKGQGDAYNFLGTYFWEEGMYDQAMKNYTKALEIRTTLGDMIGMSKTINNLGRVHIKIGNYNKAVDYFQQSLDMKGSEDTTGRSNTLINMAIAYKEKQDYEQAIKIMEKALPVAVEANYLQGQAYARRMIGEVQLEMGRLPEALENLLQATQLYERVGYFKGVAFALYSTGRVYEEQGNRTLAMDTYHRAILIAGNIGQKKLLGDIYYRSAQVAKENQEVTVAFEYYEKSIQIQQDIYKSEMQQRIVLQQISYDGERNQNEIDILKRQAELNALHAHNRDNLLLACAISLFLFGLLLIYLRQQLLVRRRKEQELLTVTHRLVEAKQRLNQLAETDHLTSLANRRYFDCKYQEQYNQASKVDDPLSVIMVDIDCFKQYNDLYGHQQGDECLKLVAKALQAIFGTNWLLARYGGEEFVIVAQVGRERSLELSEQARQAIEKMNCLHSGSTFGRVTCSFGVASTRGLGRSSPEIVLKMADQALYRAKSQGRNCVNILP